MAETSKNKIYYNDNENSVADVLADMKKMAESTDEAIENSKYNDTQIKKNISNIQKEQTTQNTDISNIKKEQEAQNTNIEENNSKIVELQTEKAKLETELKEMQEDFYQNSIRGQASGEYIHVEDSNNCRAKIGIGGNSEQETSTQNENLLILEDGTQTLNGVTMTIKDGIITFNGTATASTFFRIKIKEKLKTGDYYHLAAQVSGSHTKNIALGVVDVEEKTIYSSFNGGGGSPFNLTNDEYITYRIWVDNGNVINNQIYKCMISKGSEKKKWVKGIPNMPSTDYLSPIKAVGSNVNIFDKDNPDMFLNRLTPDNSENIVSTLTDTTKTNYIITIIVPCKGNKQYTISRWLSGKTFIVYESEKNKFNINDKVTLLKRNDNNGIINETIATSANAKYILVKIYSTWVNEENTYNDLISSIKIEKGTVATPWSQYGQGCAEINVSNENLAKKDNITNLYFNQNQISIGATSKTIIEKCLPNMTYTISKIKSTKFRVCTTNKIPQSNETIIDYIYNDTENKITITTSDKAKYMCIYFYDSNTDTLTEKEILDSIQIKIGSKSTAYEQHEEQSYIMPVQKEMLEGDYVADVEHHEWEKLTLTGNENIKLNTVFANVFNIEIPKINIMNQQVCLCNIAKGVVYNTALLTIQDNIIMTASLNKIVYKSTKFSSLSEFKTYLQNQYEEGTPVMIYYKLAEPINLELTDEQKAVVKELNNARTYKNVTNITTDSKAILSLDYAKDQETQNQKMQNEIDEIKQLLSTTQTSALLLDNMQTDIESEVK